MFLQKLTAFQLGQIPRLLWKPKIHYRAHRSLSLDPILRQINPIHTLTSQFFKAHSNIVFLTY